MKFWNIHKIKKQLLKINLLNIWQWLQCEDKKYFIMELKSIIILKAWNKLILINKLQVNIDLKYNNIRDFIWQMI